MGNISLFRLPGMLDQCSFNYKGTHSIVLLAVVDAHYRFIYLDVGNYGRHSDGETLANSSFGNALRSGVLGIPPQLGFGDRLHCRMYLWVTRHFH